SSQEEATEWRKEEGERLYIQLQEVINENKRKIERNFPLVSLSLLLLLLFLLSLSLFSSLSSLFLFPLFFSFSEVQDFIFLSERIFRLGSLRAVAMSNHDGRLS